MCELGADIWPDKLLCRSASTMAPDVYETGKKKPPLAPEYDVKSEACWRSEKSIGGWDSASGFIVCSSSRNYTICCNPLQSCAADLTCITGNPPAVLSLCQESCQRYIYFRKCYDSQSGQKGYAALLLSPCNNMHNKPRWAIPLILNCFHRRTILLRKAMQKKSNLIIELFAYKTLPQVKTVWIRGGGPAACSRKQNWQIQS